MNATLLYRIASVLLILFAAGHTTGFLTFKPPTAEGIAVRDAMQNVQFKVGSGTYSYDRFYKGFGLFLYSVSLVFGLSGVAVGRNGTEQSAGDRLTGVGILWTSGGGYRVEQDVFHSAAGDLLNIDLNLYGLGGVAGAGSKGVDPWGRKPIDRLITYLGIFDDTKIESFRTGHACGDEIFTR